MTIDHTTRRQFLGAGLLLAANPATTGAQTKPAPSDHRVAAQLRWYPEPAQHPAKEAVVELKSGATLWHWDTGGSGEAVVLLHPGTGSGAIWGYQQPVLAKAGYRVIGYSRRGHYRSPHAAGQPTGNAAIDLAELLDHLRIDRVHLVGSAAGGFVVPDFALSYPQRLLTMTIACSLAGIQDADFVRSTEQLLPPGFRGMPPEFRELSASYRAGYPDGVARWLALEHIARAGEPVRQGRSNELQWQDIARIQTPTLLMTGDADLYMPPSRLREVAKRFPNSEYAILSEAGHSAYWEQPEGFNRMLLSFFAKHR